VNDVEATAVEDVAGMATDTATDAPAADRDVVGARVIALAYALASDVAVALLIVGLIVATLLFASHVSHFIYVDF
jgi:hypothetical protein